jgi:LacI family transcriptional regulator, repressor for deo operon, udp, cdd, tsx, nupC, and nupG
MASIGRIAAELNVSKSTVSRALRGLPGVSQATIKEVRAAALRMEYVPSVAAAGLSTGRNHAVGVVVPSLNRWFYTSVVSGINRVLVELGYDTVLYDLDRSYTSGTRVFVRSILRRRVDALIVISTTFAANEVAEFALLDIPIVGVGAPTPGFRTIGVDDAAIMTMATRHVLGLGHRTLGFVGGYDSESLSVFSASEREHVFMRTALSAGAVVEPSWIFSAQYRAGVARQVVAPVFQRESWPTALVCASDEMALGAMSAIQSTGLRVPDDVSIIGIDGHEYAEAYDLTTCAQDPQAQGEFAARRAIAELEGAPPLESFDPAPFELIIRGSTSPPRPPAS